MRWLTVLEEDLREWAGETLLRLAVRVMGERALADLRSGIDEGPADNDVGLPADVPPVVFGEEAQRMRGQTDEHLAKMADRRRRMREADAVANAPLPGSAEHRRRASGRGF